MNFISNNNRGLTIKDMWKRKFQGRSTKCQSGRTETKIFSKFGNFLANGSF